MAQKKGMKRLQWNVLNWNENALKFYSKVSCRSCISFAGAFSFDCFSSVFCVMWQISLLQVKATNLTAEEGWMSMRLNDDGINSLANLS